MTEKEGESRARKGGVATASQSLLLLMRRANEGMDSEDSSSGIISLDHNEQEAAREPQS